MWLRKHLELHGQTLTSQNIQVDRASVAIGGILTFSTLTGKKEEQRNKIAIDEFSKAAGRRKVLKMYITKKEFFRASKKHVVMTLNDIIKCGDTFKMLIKRSGLLIDSLGENN